MSSLCAWLVTKGDRGSATTTAVGPSLEQRTQGPAAKKPLWRPSASDKHVCRSALCLFSSNLYAPHSPFSRLPFVCACTLPFIFSALLPPSVHLWCSPEFFSFFFLILSHFIVLMSPRLSEYKHRDEPQQVHNHRQIFWLYRRSRWIVLLLLEGSAQKQWILAKNEHQL